jgi:hypothetical protein
MHWRLSQRAVASPVRGGLLCFALLMFFCPGCGRGLSPTASRAREALSAALTAWQGGDSVGKIESASLPVMAVDSVWHKGRKLAGFEILDEVTEDDGLRRFSVRLQLGEPAATESAQYVVVGLSPIWVYREEDYQRSRSWEGYDEGKKKGKK